MSASSDQSVLVNNLLPFGAQADDLRLFDTDGPGLLPYATLLSARAAGDEVLANVAAVYEWQDAPLIFLIDADDVENDERLHRIRRLLAMRGDAPYVGLVKPGQLLVYHLALDNKVPEDARVELDASTQARGTTFAQLANKRPAAERKKTDWISDVVLNLLTGSIDTLISKHRIADEDAISLVGRALFTRFLADRGLLPSTMASAAASLFGDADCAKATSTWLDDTFNGDLLPLSEGLFARLDSASCHVLGNVLRRADGDQLFLGWEERWDNLDFAHIPVGVLSQAYELYLRNHAPARQRRQGGFYTPRPIADLLVRASFRALNRQEPVHASRILDPAAGAGVFLLTAFRELVAAHWRMTSVRPDTAALRNILYHQVCGFDIDEAALRFAALGLYLISIELDPDPRPAEKLRFKDLRGTVLRLLDTHERIGGNLGSLGPLVGGEHNGAYDLVVGNPPWSSGTGLRDWNLVTTSVSRIAKSREVTGSAPIPNEVLDLPFVWRAMEWAKPGGQIAFALHARLLFQQGDGMDEARLALFQALDVTSVINGTDLRQTKVWPEITAPFCLLIATNRPPSSSGGFRLISPRVERSLNASGVMRVDAINAEIVSVHELAETPEVLKILFRGSKADLGILQRIRSQGHRTLETFWRETFGLVDGRNLRGSGNGFQRLRPSSKPVRGGDGLPGYDASSLHGLPELTADTFTPIMIDAQQLKPFAHQRVHRLRARELFNGPLVVVHKSPPVSSGRIGVAVSKTDAVFNETFYGYSPPRCTDATGLTHYLALVLGSRLVTWFALVTSGEFGFEREVVEKVIVDRVPLPEYRDLTPTQREEISALYTNLCAGLSSWNDVDSWVAEHYGLSERDLQVISDTLEFNLPFSTNRREAERAPSPDEQSVFCDILLGELRPWTERFGTSIQVRVVSQPATSPWQALEISVGDGHEGSGIGWEGLLQVADHAAATEILVRQTFGLRIGRLAQRRYWSATQARLLAQRIGWSYLDLLQGRVEG